MPMIFSSRSYVPSTNLENKQNGLLTSENLYLIYMFQFLERLHKIKSQVQPKPTLVSFLPNKQKKTMEQSSYFNYLT